MNVNVNMIVKNGLEFHLMEVADVGVDVDVDVVDVVVVVVVVVVDSACLNTSDEVDSRFQEKFLETHSFQQMGIPLAVASFLKSRERERDKTHTDTQTHRRAHRTTER